MAIEYSLKIEKKINEHLLIEELKNMGLEDIETIKLSKGIEINQFREKLGLVLY
ncbi:hypothetical protein [Paenibacillus sp. BIHB 4019]|uniref:hypothetical protein n=1 Tax=Paenibacillus sp. BIHB 4019 TaxID=1870819 RepID=UPI0015598BC0|nr:hypothetical protein [Paenibacillus sp. BIHB 4019]